jgi:hypothetical protein
MSVRTARRIAFGVLALYAVVLTWPGLLPFNRIEPLVLGLPFVMFWIAAWVVLVGLALALLNAAETRAAERAAAADGAAAAEAAAAVPPSDSAQGSAPRAPRGRDA